MLNTDEVEARMPFTIKRKTKRIAAALIAVTMVFQGAAFMSGPACGAEIAVDSPNYADNQLLVVFDKDVTKEAALDIVAFALSEELANEGRSGAARNIGSIRSSIRLTKVKSDNNVMLAETGVSLDEETASEEISKNPDVVYAQPNYYYSTLDSADTDDTYNGDQWYLDYIDAPEAWNLIDRSKAEGKIKKNAPEVVIASLDTGMSLKNRDLKKNTESSMIASRKVEPLNSHGTKVAGVMAATSNNKRGIAGIASGNDNDIVQLMSIDVFHDERNDTRNSAATTADIISGMDYACRNNARIITMAFGRHGKDRALEDKINQTAEKGILLIASAGNNGDSQPWYPSDYTACVSCINTVKYNDAFGDECRNSASGYGGKKDIAAPGTSILTTSVGDVCTTDSGTSFAVSAVAATAAMVMYADQDMTAREVKDVLFTTAEDLGKPGKDAYTGYGNVNANRAVAKALGIRLQRSGNRIGTTAVRAKASRDGTITLDWTKISNAHKCLVYRKGPGEKEFKQIEVLPAETTTWTDSNCKPGKEYSYRVAGGATSTDGKRVIGEYSDTVKCSTKGE